MEPSSVSRKKKKQLCYKVEIKHCKLIMRKNFRAGTQSTKSHAGPEAQGSGQRPVSPPLNSMLGNGGVPSMAGDIIPLFPDPRSLTGPTAHATFSHQHPTTRCSLFLKLCGVGSPTTHLGAPSRGTTAPCMFRGECRSIKLNLNVQSNNFTKRNHTDLKV